MSWDLPPNFVHYAKIGISYGGRSAEVTAIAHPAIKDTLERAARVIRDPIIGFDFIIADITKDPATQRWGIIECNAAPFINLHHDPLEGPPNNVARHVWDAVKRKMGGGKKGKKSPSGVPEGEIVTDR